jgi:hypothetical protein
LRIHGKRQPRDLQAAGAMVIPFPPRDATQEGEIAMSIRTRIVKTAAALTLSAAAVGIVTMSPAGAVAGDPSQWGRSHNEVSVERKVNEYEGQQHKHVNEYEGQKVNEYEGQHR